MTSNSQPNCLIRQSVCGLQAGQTECPKCGIRTDVRYVSQEDLDMAVAKGTALYWQNHAQALEQTLKAQEEAKREQLERAEIERAKAESARVQAQKEKQEAEARRAQEKAQREAAEQRAAQEKAKREQLERAEIERAKAESARVQAQKEKQEAEARQAQEERQRFAAEKARRNPGQVFQDLPIAPQMVVLPSGSFMMGTAEDDAAGCENQRPQHKVTIGYKLSMGRYAVTFDEWDACVADGGVNYKPEDEGWGRGKRPVINVSWDDAQAYAAWLNTKLGIKADDPYRYRLPSEAEWEYACRAGTNGNYSTPTGQISDNDATYSAGIAYETLSPKEGRTHDKTTPVGIYAPNPWGLYDMHGNVLEWVQDDYEDCYRGAPTDGSAWKTGAANRVLRGGSWNSLAWSSRAAYRLKVPSDLLSNFGGIRLAKTAP